MSPIRDTSFTRNSNLQQHRPPPLRVHRDSHAIGKSFANSSSAPSNHNGHHHQPRLPVIVYTQTPKVIHTEPCNFMALVQKLTGMEKNDSVRQKRNAVVVDNVHPPAAVGAKPVHDAGRERLIECNTIGAAANAMPPPLGCGDPQALAQLPLSRPFLTTENSPTLMPEMTDPSLGVAPVFDPPLPQPTQFFLDVPLFTPTASDLLGAYGYQETFVPANIAGGMPPLPSMIGSMPMRTYNEF